MKSIFKRIIGITIKYNEDMNIKCTNKITLIRKEYENGKYENIGHIDDTGEIIKFNDSDFWDIPFYRLLSNYGNIINDKNYDINEDDIFFILYDDDFDTFNCYWGSRKLNIGTTIRYINQNQEEAIVTYINLNDEIYHVYDKNNNKYDLMILRLNGINQSFKMITFLISNFFINN